MSSLISSAESRSHALTTRLDRARFLRVAVVSDATRGRNGVGTYYPDLVAHLEPFLNSIQLISPDPECDRELERFRVPMPGDSSQRIVWPRTAELWSRLQQQSPHLIVIPAIGPFSFAALRYARRHRVPVVLANHTNFDQILTLYLPGPLSRPIRWALRMYHTHTFRRAAAIAAMDPEGLEQARTLGADTVRMMGTPLRVEFVSTPRRQRTGPIRKILFVGRLAAEKGILSLLEAARELPHLEFTIVGDGPLREPVNLAAGSLDNLCYRGWLSRLDVLREMDHADVLVLPSAVETFGTVALEALARRRYVLVRRDCGISRWPSFAEGLFYVERGESPASAIRRLVSLPQAELDETASHGWDAVTQFGENTVRLWLDLLADAAGGLRNHG